jgi:hypothetical protein
MAENSVHGLLGVDPLPKGLLWLDPKFQSNCTTKAERKTTQGKKPCKKMNKTRAIDEDKYNMAVSFMWSIKETE